MTTQRSHPRGDVPDSFALCPHQESDGGQPGAGTFTLLRSQSPGAFCAYSDTHAPSLIELPAVPFDRLRARRPSKRRAFTLIEQIGRAHV